jgi:hypothetical protein
LLFQNSEGRRFEVELQLGSTDESHIIRTIEYWDIERKRYPQYDHCAVLIAEDITSRFLNVISLFNGAIPLIAIQMQALRVAGKVTLVFTRVLDEMPRGLVEEDEEAAATPTDRSYWKGRASASSLSIIDGLLELTRQVDPKLELTYKKHYIGLSRDDAPFNFVIFQPTRSTVTLGITLPKTADLDAKIEQSELDELEYNSRFGRYRLRLSGSDLQNKSTTLRELIQLAHDRRTG